MCKVPEMFGALVFNDDIMRARLPKEIYKSLKRPVKTDYHLIFTWPILSQML